MRVKLYKDITTGNLYTFTEVKQEYEVSNNCEIQVDDDTMVQIINENLWSVGGNTEIICDNDPIIAWCNDYAKHMEAERYMTTEEIENSVRDIYYAILNDDLDFIEQTKTNLYPKENADDKKLLDRLNNLLSKTDYVVMDAIIYCHGKDDYSLWQLDVPENVLTEIEKLLEPYSHRGCSVRGTLNDILKDYQK